MLKLIRHFLFTFLRTRIFFFFSIFSCHDENFFSFSSSSIDHCSAWSSYYCWFNPLDSQMIMNKSHEINIPCKWTDHHHRHIIKWPRKSVFKSSKIRKIKNFVDFSNSHRCHRHSLTSQLQHLTKINCFWLPHFYFRWCL